MSLPENSAVMFYAREVATVLTKLKRNILKQGMSSADNRWETKIDASTQTDNKRILEHVVRVENEYGYLTS
jgi:hypothetical protein